MKRSKHFSDILNHLPGFKASFRIKIITTVVIACIAGNLLVISFWGPQKLKEQTEDIQEVHLDQLKTISDAIAPFLIQHQYGAAFETLNQNKAHQELWTSIALYSATGIQIYPIQPINPVPAPDSIILSHAIIDQGINLGHLRLQLNGKKVKTEILRDQYLIILIMTTGFLFAAVFITYFLDLLINKRVSLLIDAAKKLANGDKNIIFPTKSPDEIGKLTDVFEDMAKKIIEKEAQLVAAAEKAENASHAKTKFLATMSHEIRTPLNGVLGYTQALILRPNLDPQLQDDLRLIKDSSKHLLEILNDILDFSKAEADQLVLDNTNTNLSELISDTVESFRPLANNKNLQIKLKLGLPNELFSVDPIRLKQVISNLISNSIKFTKDGRISVEASLQPGPEENRTLKLVVTDTGKGISPENLKIIFDVYSKANKKFSSEGAGLGLSIVKKIVSVMNGEIDVQSEIGHGSTFTLRIPVTEKADELPAQTQTDRETQTSQPIADLIVFKRGLVLVAEDNYVNTKVVTLFLSKMGCDCIFASNGQEALNQYLKNDKIDVILMDIQMPVMDGLAATQKIRAHEVLSKKKPVPIIALTGNLYDSDKQNCFDAGINEVLGKPIMIEDLNRALAKILS